MRSTTRPTTKDLGRRWLAIVATVAAVLLIGALLALPVVTLDPTAAATTTTPSSGRAAAPSSAASSAASSAPTAPASGSASATALEKGPVKVRTLPLLADDGLVRTRFPGGAGLDDPLEVTEALDEAARAAGLEDVWGGVLDRLSVMTEEPTPASDYPYRYPGFEELEAALTPRLVAAEADDLLELVGLLELTAAQADDVNEHPTWTDVSASYAWSAAPAYLIVSRLSELAPGCDHRLALAHLVAVGTAPRPRTLDRVFSDAVQACPDDPTARWLWGQRLVGIAAAPDFYVSATDSTAADTAERPLEHFRRWVSDEPGSVLAHAGLGEALVTAAERMKAARRMPFTTRAYARQALQEFTRAAEASDEPAFEIGRGRAMSLLGQKGAADVVRAAVSATTNDEGPVAEWQLQLAIVLEQSRSFAEATEAYGVATRSVDGLRLVPEGAPEQHAWLGAEDADAVVLFDPTVYEAGGNTASWLGFVPDYRDDLLLLRSITRSQCQAVAARRTALLAGTSASDTSAPASEDCFDDDFLDDAEAWVGGDLGTWSDRVQGEMGSGPTLFFDRLQNLWRYGGDLDRADQAIDAWMDYAPGALADQRRGELLVLREDYAAAATQLQRALDAVEGADWSSTDLGVNPYEVLLQLGFAQEKAGDVEAAMTSYRRAGEESTAPRLDGFEGNIRANAESRIGLTLLDQGKKSAALPHLRLAARLAAELEDVAIGEVGIDYLASTTASGTEPNNLAVLQLDLGGAKNAKEALANARRAVAHDPRSPVFLDTLAQAQQSTGKKREAKATYDQAVAEDDTVFQSQNNLGVLASERGDGDAATRHFRQAVQAKPDYATAWFNLGVQLEKDWNPLSLLRAQRAFSEATHLDGSLRGADHVVRPDTSAQVSDLDVSRPVSLGWTLSGRSHSPVSGLTLVLLVAAIWQMLLALGLDQVGSRLSESFLRRPWSRRFVSLERWRHRGFVGLGWALVAGALIAVWPLLGGVGGGPSGAVTLLAAFALLWLFVVTVRAARPGAPVRRGWTPAMGLGFVGALVGYAFVPVPVDDGDRHSRTQWAGVVLLGTIGAVGLGIGYLSGVPLVTAVGVMAWAMFSTAMFPLKPFDGGYVRSRALRLALAGVLVAVTGAMALSG